jgi:hypothetical protein
MNPHYSYDMPENYYFGGGTETFLTPLALVALLAAVFLIFWLPRRHMMAPVLAGCLLLSARIGILFLGLHLPAIRLVLAAAWLSLAVRRELKFPRLNSLDKIFLLWAFSNAVTYSILWGGWSGVNNRLGFLWTTLGSYFLARLLIRDKADMVFAIKGIASVVLVLAPALAIEHFTQHNLFAVLGAPELSSVRYDAVRATGPFAHAIIAGTIGAMLMPLFVGLWWQGKRDRRLAGLGIVASTTIVIASASSTPIMTYGAGLLALLLWPLRQHLRAFRWVAVIGVVGLQLLMKASVWFLIARAGGSLGGSGYHRAMLIDNFIRHFGQWWLVGTQNNASWGFDMWDVDNAYVAAGIGGGLITFVLFLALMVYAFKSIGRSRRQARKSSDERMLWAIGSCLFANAVGFFGIVYFDQSILLWYVVLAMISAGTAFAADRDRVEHAPGVAALLEDRNAAAVAVDASPVPQYTARWV